MDVIYDQYYYKYYDKELSEIFEYTKQQANKWAMIASKYGFWDNKYKLFNRNCIFSAKEYIKLLGTYSDHIAIEENIRKEFFC